MLKIFQWVVSDDTAYRDKALNILDRQHDGIEIVGSSTDSDIAKVDWGGCDVILAVGSRRIGMSKITQNADELKLDTKKLLGDQFVCIPGFTLDKYRKLQHSHLSILSMNCFGGIISNTLGLPFRTPIINMYFSDQDFVRFLRAPRRHMRKPLVFKETLWQPVLKFDYPVVKMGKVEIHMNHYNDFDKAVAIWNERKARINWYNLFVTMYTEDENLLREFDALPYSKKVCFVPFKSDVDSAWYINPKIKPRLPFWNIINHFGRGDPFYYDPFDMLLYGKKTSLIEM